jgi:hypothetical protein
MAKAARQGTYLTEIDLTQKRKAHMATSESDQESLTLLERKRIAGPKECERITRLSWQTIKRQYKDRIVYLSKRRPGISVEDLIKIVTS